jgi:hypothetical protein
MASKERPAPTVVRYVERSATFPSVVRVDVPGDAGTFAVQFVPGHPSPQPLAP